ILGKKQVPGNVAGAVFQAEPDLLWEWQDGVCGQVLPLLGDTTSSRGVLTNNGLSCVPVVPAPATTPAVAAPTGGTTASSSSSSSTKTALAAMMRHANDPIGSRFWESARGAELRLPEVGSGAAGSGNLRGTEQDVDQVSGEEASSVGVGTSGGSVATSLLRKEDTKPGSSCEAGQLKVTKILQRKQDQHQSDRDAVPKSTSSSRDQHWKPVNVRDLFPNLEQDKPGLSHGAGSSSTGRRIEDASTATAPQQPAASSSSSAWKPKLPTADPISASPALPVGKHIDVAELFQAKKPKGTRSTPVGGASSKKPAWEAESPLGRNSRRNKGGNFTATAVHEEGDDEHFPEQHSERTRQQKIKNRKFPIENEGVNQTARLGGRPIVSVPKQGPALGRAGKAGRANVVQKSSYYPAPVVGARGRASASAGSDRNSTSTPAASPPPAARGDKNYLED
ncbi:unnamed protein product, partial [Amoebophrya sp. A120]